MEILLNFGNGLELLWNSAEAGNIMVMARKIYGINVEIVWNSEMVLK